MTSSTLENILDQYSETHLVCDASYPLITNTTLEEEALLYNLDKNALHEIIKNFITQTGKNLTFSSDINNLSGGQKVLLMVLLALYSNAQNIVFANLEVSLDTLNSKSVLALIGIFKSSKQDILVLDSI